MISLHDSAAVDWLAERGIDATTTPPFPLLGDEAARGGFAVRRLSHGPATLRRPASRGAGRILLLLPLEGALTLTTGGSSRVVDRGSFAALPDESGWTLVTGTGSARLELIARPSAATGVLLPSRTPFTGSSPVAAVVASTANAILDSGVAPADPAFAGLQAALEDLLGALLGAARPASA